MYVDFAYYVEIYDGSLIPEKLFPRTEKKAERYLDTFTFGRLKDMDLESVNNLKDCICDMAEVIYMKLYQGNTKEKKSEDTDGYSVSYVTEGKDGEDAETVLKRKLYSIAEVYFSVFGLLDFSV